MLLNGNTLQTKLKQKMKNIAFCSEAMVQKHSLSDVKLVIGYTEHNVAFLEDKGIPFQNSYIVHEPYCYYNDERKERLESIVKAADAIETGTILVYCEYGKSRSRELASILAHRYDLKYIDCFTEYDGKPTHYEIPPDNCRTFFSFLMGMAEKIPKE